MENNMKYIKLYENFQERKPISDEDWKKFEEVHNKFGFKFGYELWEKKNLFDNGDRTFDYDGSLNFYGMEIKSLLEVIPFPIKNVDGDFFCDECTGLETLEGAPQSVGKEFSCNGCTGLETLDGAPLSVGGSFYCSGCTELTTLKGAPQSVGKNFNCNGCTGLTSLKYAPQTVGKSFWCHYCTGLISDVNDYDYEVKGWYGILAPDLIRFLKSEKFSLPVWYESLAFVGARNPEQLKKLPDEVSKQTTFTQEQVEEIYKLDLIDYESTLVDAAKAGLPAPQEIMDRTKKYDHSEYRDSKLDSEWKDVF